MPDEEDDPQPVRMPVLLLPNDKFGRNLRKAREAAGLTQAQVAFRAGVSQNRIPLIEAGQTQFIRRSTAEALAMAVEIDVETLFGRKLPLKKA